MTSNGGSRIGVLLLSVIVGLGVGYLVAARRGKSDLDRALAERNAAREEADKLHRAPTPPAGPVIHAIVVGPTAADLSLKLSKLADDRIQWTSKAGLPLKIVFKNANLPQNPDGSKKFPFEGMTMSGTDWLVTCTNNVCDSGVIKANLDCTNGPIDFKYDQILNGVRVDGRIIIDK